MLNAMVIGVGGAGNNAAVELIETKVLGLKSVVLVNKTEVDIPKKFKEDGGQIYIINSEKNDDGSGGEREIGRKEMLTALQNNTLPIEKIIDPSCDLVIIVSSTEGGSGSGGAPTLARYIQDVMGIETQVHAFTGFEVRPRHLRNTIGFFKEIPETVSLTVTRNKKCLKGNSTDHISAEREANRDFCITTSIMLGNMIKPSAKNIDPADLKKVSVLTPGYKTIGYIELPDKLKSAEQYNEYVKEMIANLKSMDSQSKSQKALAVIINVPEAETKFIDGSQSVLTEYFGQEDLYDSFCHVQSVSDQPRFIGFISSGSNIPLDEVEAIYEKYVESSNKINRGKDSFFESVGEMEYEDDSKFDTLIAKKNARGSINTAAKNSFFSSFNAETPNRPSSNAHKEAAATDMKEY